MPNYVDNNDWIDYKNVVNEFHEDAFQQEITLRRVVKGGLDPHGEDTPDSYTVLILKGLLQYNDYRTWPSTKNTSSGEVDKQNTLLYLNIKYLKDNNLTNGDGFLDFDPGHDRFILKGQEYKALGESQTAQASDEPLLQYIILKREEKDTTDSIY